MKTCPSCGYGNPDQDQKCGICAKDLSAIPAKAAAKPQTGSGLMLGAGLLLLACGALYFITSSVAKPPARASANTYFLDEASFSYDGTLYALDKMGSLRFLPAADRHRILPLLTSPDDRVARAAAKLTGAWARSSENSAEAKVLFEALLRTAASGSRIARRAAAFQASLVAESGFPIAPYLAEIRRVSASLMATREAELTAAGFLLASAAGVEDFSREMLDTLRSDPSSGARLYAACGLARLGSEEGGRHLIKLASGGDSELRSEAFSCLTYAFDPETGPFLTAAARGGDPDLAERAKMALILRKQLAIINK